MAELEVEVLTSAEVLTCRRTSEAYQSLTNASSRRYRLVAPLLAMGLLWDCVGTEKARDVASRRCCLEDVVGELGTTELGKKDELHLPLLQVRIFYLKYYSNNQ